MMEEISEIEKELTEAQLLHRIPTDFIPDLEKRPLSYSSLKHFNNSPLHFLQYLTAPKKSSIQMFLGDVVDCLLLTPDDFETKFITVPDNLPKRPTSAQLTAKYRIIGSKEFDAAKDRDVADREQRWVDFETSCVGKRIIPSNIMERANRMVESVKNYAPAVDLLNKLTSTQRTVYFTDPETKLNCIVKMDGCGDGLVVDLKSTNDAEPDKYTRTAFDFDYHIQCGISLMAMQSEFFISQYKVDFFHIIVESVEPFAVDVRKADDNYKRVGVGEVKRLLQEVIYCRDNNLWRTAWDFKRFFDKVGNLSLPSYAHKLIERHQ